MGKSKNSGKVVTVLKHHKTKRNVKKRYSCTYF